MKWIDDRNPKSAGMYAVTTWHCRYTFAYFDGKGWTKPDDTVGNFMKYDEIPTWLIVEWGRDE